MYCSRKINRKINHIRERALRLVYNDYTASFGELLIKDGSITIHHRNIQYVATEMYKVINGLSPPLINDIFEKAEIMRPTTRLGSDFVRPNINTHLSLLYNKVSQKVSPLARVVRLVY